MYRGACTKLSKKLRWGQHHHAAPVEALARARVTARTESTPIAPSIA